MKKDKPNNLLPQYIDLMIIGTCNMNCPFCFGPRHEIPQMPTDSVKKLLSSLSSLGVKGVVFTGGEPTLIKNLPEILSFAKQCGLKTVLSTNGLEFYRNRNFMIDCIKYLDWISFPIDAYSEDISEIMRPHSHSGNTHNQKIFSLIRDIRKLNKIIGIKIGTVVTKINRHEIAKIPQILSENKAFPDTWKLYQISPSNYGKDNYESLSITKEEFQSTYEESLLEAHKYKMGNVQKYTNEERIGKYLFIDPEGKLLIIDKSSNDYREVGTLEDIGSNKIITEINGAINIKNLTSNFDDTYPFRY